MSQTNISLGRDMYEQVRQYAFTKHISMSQVVRLALQLFLSVEKEIEMEGKLNKER